jgi:hypothetical protein
MAEWISVKDYLPEPHVDVLTYRAKNGYMEVVHRTKNRWWCEHKSNPITHWMHLPDAPKGVSEDG